MVREKISLDTLKKAFLDNERVAIWATHALIVMMAFFVGVSFMNLAHNFFPAYSFTVLPLLFSVITLEALASQRQIRALTFLQPGWLAYRISELVVMSLVLRLIFFLRNNPGEMWTTISRLGEDFGLIFQDGEFTVSYILLMLVWMSMIILSENLLGLEGDLEILASHGDDAYVTDRNVYRDRLATPVFTIGMVMIMIATLTRLDAYWQGVPLGETRIPGGNILVYFILALVLLSQGHLSVLRAQWGWLRIPISPKIGWRWLWVSVVSVLLISGGALLLPTQFSFSLAQTIQLIIQILVSILAFLIMAILFLPLMFLSWLNRDRVYKMPEILEIPPLAPLVQGDQPVDLTEVPWAELLKSIVFWVFFLILVGYALYHYAAQNKALFARLKDTPIISGLLGFLERLFGWIGGMAGKAAALARDGFRQVSEQIRRGPSLPRWSLPKIGQLPARERVRYYFLALIKQGEEVEIHRTPAQTPGEYSASVKEKLGEGSEELERLTAAFIEARYTDHEVKDDQAAQAKNWFQQIIDQIKRKRDEDSTAN